MTSSTEELRRLLDERGVEYDIRNDFVTHVFFDDRAITFYSDIVDGEMESVSVAVDFPKPVLNGTVWLTPEQAVEAALGRGTCRDVWQDDVHANFKCSECGETLNVRDKGRVACCPFCKREVMR